MTIAEEIAIRRAAAAKATTTALIDGSGMTKPDGLVRYGVEPKKTGIRPIYLIGGAAAVLAAAWFFFIKK